MKDNSAKSMIGDVVGFAKYRGDSDADFISWTVIGEQKGKLIMISTDIIDTVPEVPDDLDVEDFNEFINSWLNTYFYDEVFKDTDYADLPCDLDEINLPFVFEGEKNFKCKVTLMTEDMLYLFDKDVVKECLNFTINENGQYVLPDDTDDMYTDLNVSLKDIKIAKVRDRAKENGCLADTDGMGNWLLLSKNKELLYIDSNGETKVCESLDSKEFNSLGIRPVIVVDYYGNYDDGLK